MASLKNLLKGKKKSDKKNSNYQSSTGNLSTTSSKGGSQPNLAGCTDSLGYIIKEKDLSKLLKAAWNGDLNKLSQISNKKTNWNETDKEQRTALHLACAKGFKGVVNYLISNGADTNKSDSEGKTPLMKACENNSLDIVDALLKAGAHTNIYDANHMTALHIAATNGDADIGQMLANRDAKLDAKDMNQVTPLHLSCLLGHMAFTEFLISEYVQIDPLDNQKRTPLMTACFDGHMDIVQLLLQHDADWTLKDKDGLTAMDLAKQSQNDAIVKYLDDMLKKKKKKMTSPSVASIHSRGSIQRASSPVDDALNDILSPGSRHSGQGAAGGFANLFGGPAVNVGGMGMIEKSEESHSEELGDNSWEDSDTDDFDGDKKSKGINLTAMIKKKKEDERVKENNQSLGKSGKTKNSTPPMTTGNKANKLPWQQDSDDETESKWDDDEDSEIGTARNRKTPRQSLHEVDSPKTKQNDQPKTKVPTKPVINLDESQESIDFDSSMPDDASFGDLPLSEADGHNDKPKISFLKALNIKEEDEDEESNWDDSSLPLNQKQQQQKEIKTVESPTKNGVTTALNNSKTSKEPESGKSTKPGGSGQQRDEEEGSGWDSDTPLSSEPSEEVLPPRTPEPGSEFEPSTSGDEESDFSLGENMSKHSPIVPPKDGVIPPSGVGIFQTELGANFDSSEDEDDDDLEQQMQQNLNMAKKEKITAKETPQNEKPNKLLTNRQKQLADLGLDFGSDVSSVSDPEGFSTEMDAPDGFGDANAKDSNNNENTATKKNPLDFRLSSDEEDSQTESESEWEKEQRNKRLSKDPVLPSVTEKECEQKVSPNEDTKVKTQLTAPPPPVADSLDLSDDESSDFSFSENDNLMSGKVKVTEDYGDEDEAEAFLLKQMEVAEANVNKETVELIERTPDADDFKYKEENDRKSVLESEIEMKKMALEEEQKMRRLELEEEERKRKLKMREEDEARQIALAEQEEMARKKIEAQELEVRERLALEAETKRKELELETKKRKEDFMNEETERRRELEKFESDLKARVKAQEEELKSIEAEKLKQQKELELENEKLHNLEKSKETTRLSLEKELNEIKDKIKNERERVEEVEREAKLKESEYNERLQKLHDEETKIQIRLDDNLTLEQNIETRNNLHDSLEIEEQALREKLRLRLAREEEERRRKIEEEHKAMQAEIERKRESEMRGLNDTLEQERGRLYADLEKEEIERRRKLSEEGRMFRDSLEAEREKKLKELFDQSEDDRIEMSRKIKTEEQLRLSQLEEEVKKKEKSLNERLSKIEADRLKDISEKEKKFEKELEQKLKKMEDEKNRELSRLNAEVEAARREKNNEGFHDLERKSRLRDKELEIKLMEVRRQQAAAKNEVTLSDVPPGKAIVEDVIQAVNQSSVEAGNEVLNLENTDETISKINRNEDSIQSLLNRAKESKNVDVAIDMIGGSNTNNYSFEHQQNNIRFARGASTPNPQMMTKHAYFDESHGDFEEIPYRDRYLPKERMRFQEMQFEMEEMQRTIDALNKSQNDKERSRLDTDLEVQSLKYKLEQETEAKLMAERLCKQLKDQLSRSEKKLMKEAESKQSIEIANRKLQAEMKSKEQQSIKFDADINELQIQLNAEKESRKLQEELYQEQLRHNESILREAQKTSHNHAQAMTKLEMLGDARKQYESSTESLKMELAKAKGELARLLSQIDEKQVQLENETNTASNKLQQKIDEIGEVEKKLMHLQLQYDNEKANRQTVESQLTSQLENEKNLRHQLEVEVVFLKNRLEHSNREIDRLGDKTSKWDKEAKTDKENHIVEKFQLEKELTLTQSQLKNAEEKIERLEVDLSSARGELQNTGRALAEHKDEAFGAQRNHHEMKETMRKLEDDLRQQQMSSAKLESQLESAREKCVFLGDEKTKIQKELDKTKEVLSTKEKELAEKNDKLLSTLSNVKDKSQQEKTELLLQNEQNKLLLDKLQNQLERKEELIKENNDTIRILKQELHETKTGLDVTKIENENLKKENEVIEKEKSHLREDVKHYEAQVDALENTNQSITNEFSSTKYELNKTIQLSDEANKRLALRSNDIAKLENANVELRTGLEDIKRQNLMIESDLREEKGKAEVLLHELQSANEARENLESILSNIKGNNALLEEKLHTESLHRTQREREAEEHKNLWESEVKSRSKLGVQLIDLEKKIEEQKIQIEEERKKSRDVLEMKKTSDNKMEIFEQRSTQHQEEMAAMRNKLKQYQRKMKKYEGDDNDLDKERELLSSNVSKLRQQLRDLADRLKREQLMRTEAEKKNYDQMSELSDLKTKAKVHKYEIEKLENALESLNKDLSKQKSFFEKHYIPEESLEEFKQALERKCRLDLNKKLQEVNMHLEEQALAREAFDKIRNDKEYKTRKELEDTIVELKCELNNMRGTLHEGLAKRDTSQCEARRYKDLLESEICSNEKLSSKLAQTTDLLSAERSRTNHLLDDSYKSPVSKQLFKDSPSHWASMNVSTDFDIERFRRSTNKYSTPLSKPTSSSMKSPHKELLLSSIPRRPLYS